MTNPTSFSVNLPTPVGGQEIVITLDGDEILSESVSKALSRVYEVESYRLRWPKVEVISKRIFGRALARSCIIAELVKLGLEYKKN